MKIADVLLQDYDAVISNTRRTLERVPGGKNTWVPHEKSMVLGKLAMHCASLPQFGFYILEDDGMDMAAPRHPQAPLEFTTADAALERLDESAARCRAALAAASDERLLALWRFSFGEHLISEKPRSLTFRQVCIDHLIHHTAQLGIYLRLNGIPVPGLYGPSADEPWTPPKA